MILLELELEEFGERWRGTSLLIGEVDGPAPSSFANDLLVRAMEKAR